MTTNMKYLQDKGIFLMPIVLASTISSSSGKSIGSMGVRTSQSKIDKLIKESSINKDAH